MPASAKIAILAILENDLRISTDIMLRAVAQENHFNMNDPSERSYWTAKCQQFMAGIRDKQGYRMVFNVPAKSSVNHTSEYVVLSACGNKSELQAIRHRLHSYVVGLEESISQVDARIKFGDAVAKYKSRLK